jgi:hypothetical protein
LSRKNESNLVCFPFWQGGLNILVYCYPTDEQTR